MKRWRSRFSKQELDDLRRVDVLPGLWMVTAQFLIVGLALAACALVPHPVVVLLAMLVIGGRQLGLAIVMHEAAHNTLLPNRRANDWLGNWGGAYWVFLSVGLYRPYHLEHHAHAGSVADPDMPLKAPYPASKASMARKLLRDASGVVGVQRLVGVASLLFRAATGRHDGKETVTFFGSAIDPGAARRALRGFVCTQGLLLGVLVGLGHGWLFAVWAGSWLTTYSVSMRVRSIAEHGMTDEGRDPFRNTRTVIARWWERLLFAPSRVNHHLEHHLLMTVPHDKLPRLHAMLAERGLLDGAEVVRGYPAVLRRAVR